MANDNQIIVEIVLDDGSIQKGFLKVKEQAKDTGSEINKSWKEAFSPKSITDFASGFYLIKEAAKGASAVIKEAFDLVLEGEKIKALNIQFELLAQNAGLAGGALKSGLEESAAGLIDTEDLLQVANKAIVQFGSDASKLPEILEQARKAAALTGTDTASAFETINHAIATGNQRALKNLGITVDLTKAYKDYADSLGLAVSQLTEEQQVSARMNATLDQMKIKLAGVDPELAKTTNSWTRFKVAINEAYDTLAILINKMEGGTFAKALDVLSGVIKGTATAGQSLLGTGAAKAQAEIEILTTQIEYLEKSLKNPNMSSENWMARIEAEQKLPALREQLRITQLQLEGFKGTVEDSLSGRAASKAGVQGVIDLNKQQLESFKAKNLELLKSQNSYTQQMLQMQQQELASKIEAAKGISSANDRQIELAKLAADRQIQLENEKELAISQAKEKYNKPEDLQKFLDLKLAIVETYAAKEKELHTKIAEEITTKNKINFDLTNQVVQGMVNVTSQAMAKLALALRGADNGWQNFQNTIISVLGDTVVAIGQAILAIGIAMLELDVALKSFTPWGAIAAGAGLMLLGSMMKASVGDTLSNAASGGSASGGGIATDAGAMPTNEVATAQERSPTSSLVVNVNGNILGDESSGALLVDYINKAFDEKGVSIRSGAIA